MDFTSARSFAIDFVYSFIPIFVAMDVGGLIPIFLSLTKNLSPEDRRQVSLQALFTAFIISLIILAIGRLIFQVIGITVPDFEIAGGLLLLVLAILEMVQRGDPGISGGIQSGAVPLGTPLIAGPAVLTSLIILVGIRGYPATFAALVANLVIVWLAFHNSRFLAKLFSENGLRASSQVISLFLAAIAVSMIRRGLQGTP